MKDKVRWALDKILFFNIEILADIVALLILGYLLYLFWLFVLGEAIEKVGGK